MFKSAERKKSQGFTLAEVLIVVAIIVILLAVAIPNIISYYRSLKLTELDDSARTIFMAAQNRLTAMKSAGEDLSALSDIDVDENAGPGTGTGKYLAVTEAQADSLASLVPGGSIESQLHNNHYVVEIDPKTGAVYAVWYWEKEDFDYKNESYDEVKPEKDKRLDAGRMVGYYGGSFVVRPNIGQTPMPSAQVINAEELKLEITVPGYTGGSAPVINATVTLSDRSGHKVTIINEAKLDYDSGPKNIYSGTIILDTLDDTGYDGDGTAPFAGKTKGKPFKEWVETYPGSGIYTIEPGANFDIEVKVTAVDPAGSKDYLPQYIYWTDVNSLFESVDGGTAKIAYGRHLQNLDTATSGVNKTSTTITAAEQVRDIDFDDDGSGIQSWDDTYKGTTAGAVVDGHTHHTFHAINNNNLTSFNGDDKTIRNLNVDESGAVTATVAGLFGSFGAGSGGSTSTISGVTLINAKVKSAGNVGALIGETTANTVNVSGCKVYVDDDLTYDPTKTLNPYITSSSGAVGGLIGSIGGTVTISNSFASTVEEGSSGSVGGLVGSAASATGTSTTLTVQQSYAAGYLTGGNMGGLVGSADGGTVTVENSYAAGIIASATTAAGGLIGNDSTTSPSISNSYAAVRYVTTGVSTVYGAAPDAGTTAYYIAQNGVTYENNSGEGKNDAELKTALSGIQWSPTFGDTHAYGLTSETKNLVGKGYPYPMLFATDSTGNLTTDVLPHYGDWLFKEAASYSFGYYDNGGGSYGFWGYIFNPATGKPEPITNGLATGTSGTYATDDGYCIPVEQIGGASTAPAAPTVDGVTGISIENTPVGTYTDSTTHKTYDLYKVNGLDGVDKTSFYNKITVGSTEYWFNPFFACEVQTTAPANMEVPGAKKGAAGGSDTEEYSGQVVIRTARQLAWLGELTQGDVDSGGNYKNNPYFTSTDAEDKNFYLHYAYNQLLDIDYNRYTGDYDGAFSGKSNSAGNLQIPINLLKGSTNGSYDGNQHEIKNLNIKTTYDRAGLFGRVKGKVIEVTLVNANVSSSAEEASVGGLIGETIGSGTNPPEVTDCGIYIEDGDNYGTYTIEATKNNSNAGGLIGNAGQHTAITRCFAAVKVTGTSNAGGLVGITKQSVKLENCYSGGHTDGGSYSPTDANVTANSNAGGLVGRLGGKSGSENVFSGICYSTCSVSGSNTGGLIGRIENTAPVTDGATLYATGTDIKGSLRSESYLTDLKDVWDTSYDSVTAHPYDGNLSVDGFHYKSSLSDHHGDWVE